MAAEATYATVAEVDTFAADNGKTQWAGIDSDLKLSYVLDATNDIVAYHKQLNIDGTLWVGEDPLTATLLKKSCYYQALYVAKIAPQRDVADKIRTIGDNYKDRNLSVENAGSRELNPTAQRFASDANTLEGINRSASYGRPRPRTNTFALGTLDDENRAVP